MGLFDWLFGSSHHKATETATEREGIGDAASVLGAPAIPDAVDGVCQPPRQRVTIVEVIGDVAVVTFVSSHAFYGCVFPARNEVEGLVNELGRRKLLLDFSHIKYFTKAALGWLLTLDRQMKAAGGKLVLWRLNAMIQEIFRITRLYPLFTIINESDHITALEVIREALGNSPRPPVLSPEWRTTTVVALARQMYESQDFSALSILADALQEAGCDNEDILAHCRSDSPHAGRCRVLDLIIAKEFTWQADIEGVPVVGFVDRSGSGVGPDATHEHDVAEFGQRMEGLVSGGVGFAVVDFACYRMTGWDNGRAVLSSLLSAHRRLGGRGGGLLVCHHPAQLNPDLQGAFKFDKVIGIYRSRQEAITAALSLGRGEPPGAVAREAAPEACDSSDTART